MGKQIVGRVGECLAESREPFNAPDGFGASLAAKLGPGLAFTPLDELEPCELQFRFGACPEEQAFSFAVNAIPFQDERRGGRMMVFCDAQPLVSHAPIIRTSAVNPSNTCQWSTVILAAKTAANPL